MPQGSRSSVRSTSGVCWAERLGRRGFVGGGVLLMLELVRASSSMCFWRTPRFGGDTEGKKVVRAAEVGRHMCCVSACVVHRALLV